MVFGKDGIGQVVETTVAVLTLVSLAVGLGFIKAPLDQMLRATFRTAHRFSPSVTLTIK